MGFSMAMDLVVAQTANSWLNSNRMKSNQLSEDST
ncbi:hypothetical protein SAMN05444158_5459 [Bradyrhizobium canariense]|uniref:Uncharacterized protein n=1 Tax=Bradyrhizobium canariense TaxID=255045 RepID=A0A1H1ZHV9_9BRAD|nr:hypothetical protein SAMN05444158_5459 [Bradyrhizobium canariense]